MAAPPAPAGRFAKPYIPPLNTLHLGGDGRARPSGARRDAPGQYVTGVDDAAAHQAPVFHTQSTSAAPARHADVSVASSASTGRPSTSAQLDRGAMHFSGSASHRGQARCKWCTQLVPSDAASQAAHESTCAFATVACDFADSETGALCKVTARGRNLLAEHQARCPFRRIACAAGCGREVSVQAASQHLLECGQQSVQCSACRAVHPRSAIADHEQHCLEALVPCPLGCGEILRRRDVPIHVRDAAVSHVPRLDGTHHLPGGSGPSVQGVACEWDAEYPLDSPAVVYTVLVQLLRARDNELHRTQAALESANAALRHAKMTQAGAQSSPPSSSKPSEEPGPARRVEPESEAPRAEQMLEPRTPERATQEDSAAAEASPSLPDVSPSSTAAPESPAPAICSADASHAPPAQVPPPQAPPVPLEFTDPLRASALADITRADLGPTARRSRAGMALSTLARELNAAHSGAEQMPPLQAMRRHRLFKGQIDRIPTAVGVCRADDAEAAKELDAFVDEVDTAWFQCQRTLYERSAAKA